MGQNQDKTTETILWAMSSTSERMAQLGKATPECQEMVNKLFYCVNDVFPGLMTRDKCEEAFGLASEFHGMILAQSITKENEGICQIALRVNMCYMVMSACYVVKFKGGLTFKEIENLILVLPDTFARLKLSELLDHFKSLAAQNNSSSGCVVPIALFLSGAYGLHYLLNLN
jgi:hypothetical protein